MGIERAVKYVSSFTTLIKKVVGCSTLNLEKEKKQRFGKHLLAIQL
jgi:hypothetical protein